MQFLPNILNIKMPRYVNRGIKYTRLIYLPFLASLKKMIEQMIITQTTTHVRTVNGRDVITKHAISTPMIPEMLSGIAAALWYLPALMNGIDPGGIKNAQDPIMIGNAISADNPRSKHKAIHGA